MQATGTPRGHDDREEASPFRSLWRWFRPYLVGSGVRLFWTVVATAMVLACQAIVPLQVNALLSDGTVVVSGIGLLAVLLIVQFTSSYLSHLGARDIAADAAFRLRLRVFEATLHSRVLRQDGLVRSSVVSRHTTDVDHVGEAFERTVAEGVPGVIRVVQSLILLTWLDWRAGAVMTAATGLFLLTRRIVGARLLVADRAKLDASSRVGETVDESVTATRIIAGLHLEAWVSGRFAKRAALLRELTRAQGSTVTRLVTGASGAGLIGLFAVVVFGVVVEGDNLSIVAASLLYVDAVVRGLESLPGWIRSLQLAVVSRRRIDQILDGPNAIPEELAPVGSGYPHADVVGPRPQLTGLVTDAGVDDDEVLARLSIGDHGDPWRVSLEGQHVRRPGIEPTVLHVPADSVAFNASVLDHLAAVSELDDAAMEAILTSVGLGMLVEDPERVRRPLGPVGAGLTANDRQRLALAVAIAAAPELLLIGPLACTWDSDTATPIVTRLRTAGISTVMSVRTSDAAALMDQMMFVTGDGLHLGSHDDLLVACPAYAAMWERRLHGDEVDLSALGLADGDEAALHARLVTERQAAGDVIYRQGDPADRVVFIVSGHVEVTHLDAAGVERRVALLGPGNHCGDLRLTVGERRAETATAVDACVVRSLSRDAVEASATGLLDRPVAERRIVASLLRSGPATRDQIQGRLEGLPPQSLAAAIDVLIRDGAVDERDGVLSAVLRRSARTGSRDILARLHDL